MRMTNSIRRASQIAATALIITVVTQLLYVASEPLGFAFNTDIVWALEVLAFLAVAIFGLALLPARPVAGAAIGIGGAFNVIQAGMGLVMFGPLREAGEAGLPAFQAVLAGAFLLYFAGKAAFALAGILLGLSLWQEAGGAAKYLGLAAIVTGLGGLGMNLLASVTGMQFVFPAGAAGTAATLFLAIILTAGIDRSEAPISA